MRWEGAASSLTSAGPHAPPGPACSEASIRRLHPSGGGQTRSKPAGAPPARSGRPYPYPLPPLRLGRQLLHDTMALSPLPHPRASALGNHALGNHARDGKRALRPADHPLRPAAPSWAALGPGGDGCVAAPHGCEGAPCGLCKLPAEGRHRGCVVTLNGQLGTLQRAGLKQIPRADEPGGRSGRAPTTRLGGMPRHMPCDMPRMGLFTSC